MPGYQRDCRTKVREGFWLLSQTYNKVATLCLKQYRITVQNSGKFLRPEQMSHDMSSGVKGTGILRMGPVLNVSVKIESGPALLAWLRILYFLFLFQCFSKG